MKRAIALALLLSALSTNGVAAQSSGDGVVGTPDEEIYETISVTEGGVPQSLNCYWIPAGDLDGAYAAGFGYPPVILTGNHGWLLCYHGDPHSGL